MRGRIIMGFLGAWIGAAAVGTGIEGGYVPLIAIGGALVAVGAYAVLRR